MTYKLLGILFAAAGLLAAPAVMPGTLHALKVKVEPSITFRPGPRPVRYVRRVPAYSPPRYYYYEPEPIYFYEYYEPYYYPEPAIKFKFR